jgi:N-acetylmuramoyl-L-alanine amidase
MNIQERLLTPNPYSRRQKPNVPKMIVVHYVGNPGSSAIGNRNYFDSLKKGLKLSNGNYRYASSHYIIGLKGEIIRCVPENEEAIHASDGVVNVSSIGIENCHPDWTGKFTDATLNSLIELCVDICKRYGMNPEVDIIRHFDVPKSKKKDCPRWFVSHPQDFVAFKKKVAELLKPADQMAQRIQETVNGLVNHTRADNKTAVSLDPTYWQKVFRGEEIASKENIMTIMRRLMKME